MKSSQVDPNVFTFGATPRHWPSFGLSKKNGNKTNKWRNSSQVAWNITLNCRWWRSGHRQKLRRKMYQTDDLLVVTDDPIPLIRLQLASASAHHLPHNSSHSNVFYEKKNVKNSPLINVLITRLLNLLNLALNLRLILADPTQNFIQSPSFIRGQLKTLLNLGLYLT